MAKTDQKPADDETPVDVEPAPTPETKPANVIEALAWVTANMGGIAKKKRQKEAGERDDNFQFYAYRGIDAIAAQAQRLLGVAGVVIVPTEGKIVTVDEIMVKSNPWTDTTVTVNWTIYGPGGVDDKIESITQGIGRDNTDKGYNKAMTGAFKNLLLRILCIGDPKDDTDNESNQGHATDAAPTPPALDDPERVAAVEQYERMLALEGEQKAVFAEIRSKCKTPKRRISVPELMDATWRLAVQAMIDLAVIQAAGGTVDDTGPIDATDDGDTAGLETETTPEVVHTDEPTEP